MLIQALWVQQKLPFVNCFFAVNNHLWLLHMYIMWCWLMSLLQGCRSLGTEGEEWSPSPGSDPGFAERLFQSGCRLCQRSYNSPTLYYTKDIKAVVTILLWNLKYSSKYVWSFCRRNYFHSCNYFLIFRASYGLYYMLTASGIACKNRRPTVFQSYLTKRKICYPCEL